MNEALSIAPRRPVMRYHGGKWRLAPWVISHFPPHRTYVEPFGGAASVLLRKERSYAEVYNDLDGEVVNLFRILREPAHAAALAEAVSLTPFSRVEFQEAYVPADDFIQRARQLIVRAGMGFGSASATRNHKTGFRTNVTRSGTTPAIDWSRWPDIVPAVVERLRGVIIEERNAVTIMRQFDSVDTLFYVDPPYVHASRSFPRGGTQPYAYRHELDDAGHRSLAECLHGLRGTVVLSGYPSDLYSELFSGWTRHEKASHADGARARTEVLWIKPADAPHPAISVVKDFLTTDPSQSVVIT